MFYKIRFMSEKPAFFQKLYRTVVNNPDYRSVENPQNPITSQTVIDMFGGQESESGVEVNPDTALTNAAYYRANEVLNHTMASVPLAVYGKGKDGSRTKVDHDVSYLLKSEPNPIMTAFTFKETGQGQLNNYGNFYAEIERHKNGSVKALWPIDYNEVTPKVNKRRLVYKVEGTSTPIKSQDMYHVPGFGFNGLVGKPKIELMAESLGLGLVYQKYASRFMKNDATPPVALIAKGDITNDQKDATKKSWQSAQSGKNKGRSAVMSGDWDLKTFSVPPEQAQFLQSRVFSVSEIARWTGIPPHLLFELDRATHNNIEHQLIEFVMFTILGWCTKWEQEYNRKLFTPEERKSCKYYTKHNINGLMRADAQSRAEFYKALSGISALSANKILEMEDMNPVENGDKRYTQMQNIPTDRVDEYVDSVVAKGLAKSKKNGK